MGGWTVPGSPRAALDPSASEALASRRSTQPSRGRRPSLGDDRDSAWTDLPEAQAARAAVRPARRSGAPLHVVRPGETPRSIAQDRLGDARRAHEIIELNHEQLAKEGRWRPGLSIRLPADVGPSREEP